MTAYVSAASGNFSDNLTWTPNTGHPSVNGDTFTIGAHTVTMDIDTSGLTGFGTSVINGTLQFKRSAGTYILKMNGNLSGTGVIDMSDGAGGVYASGQVGEVRFNGNFSNSMTGVQNLICVEPNNKFAILTQAESSGAVTMHIDRDLTAEPVYWKAGDLVQVANVNAGRQSEQYTLQSVTSNTVVLTSGVTNSKLIGSYIVLVTRNAKITGTGAGVGTGFSNPSQSSVIKAEVRGLATGVTGNGVTALGGCISNCTTGYGGQRAHPATSVVFCGCTTACDANVRGALFSASCLVVGCGTGFSGCLAPGILCDFVGCGTCIAITGGYVANCRGIGCTTLISSSSGVVMSGVSTTGCSIDVNTCEFMTFINCNLTSPTPFNNATLSSRAVNGYIESIDDGQVPGAFKAYPVGGAVTSVLSPVYDASRPRSYQHSPVSATFATFMQRTIFVPAGGSIYVRCYVQKNASMAAYPPRLWVFSADKEPLISGSPDAEAVMTDSLNAWEVLEIALTNTTTSDKPYIVRTLAMNATGLVYFDPIIRVSGFMPEASMSMVGGMVA